MFLDMITNNRKDENQAEAVEDGMERKSGKEETDDKVWDAQDSSLFNSSSVNIQTNGVRLVSLHLLLHKLTFEKTFKQSRANHTLPMPGQVCGQIANVYTVSSVARERCLRPLIRSSAEHG